MHIYENELAGMVLKLQECRQYADTLPPQMAAIKLRVQNAVLPLQNMINAMIGAGMETHGKGELPQLEEMFGEKINRPQPITREQLQPDSEEKRKFLEDRDNLFGSFMTLGSDKIFNKLKQPGGEAVIRAVAKKAGYGDYAEAPIDVLYVDAVKKLMQDKATIDNKLKEAEKKTQAFS